jgi:hypothetical protein
VVVWLALLCGQWEAVECWLARLVVVVVLRPAVGSIADMDRLRTHGSHLLRGFSPWVDTVPDRRLLLLQGLRVLVASALDSLVAVFENDAVLSEKRNPHGVKLFALIHLVQQFVEGCFVNLAYMILLVGNSTVSATAQEKKSFR